MNKDIFYLPQELLSGNRYIDYNSQVKFVTQSEYFNRWEELGMNDDSFELLRVLNGKKIATSSHPQSDRFWTIYPETATSAELTQELRDLSQKFNIRYIVDP